MLRERVTTTFISCSELVVGSSFERAREKLESAAVDSMKEALGSANVYFVQTIFS